MENDISLILGAIACLCIYAVLTMKAKDTKAYFVRVIGRQLVLEDADARTHNQGERFN